jgi:hypothetical protein
MNYVSLSKKQTRIETFMFFFRRFMAILGMGLCIGITFTPSAIIFYWSALPAIGLAGFVTNFFIALPRKTRGIIAGIGLIIYQIVLSLTVKVEGINIRISDWNLSDVHGGFIGGFGWGMMMLMGTVICEAFETKKMRDFVIFGIIFTVLGIILHLIYIIDPNNQSILWGISKNRVSISYILISLGLASLSFYGIWFLYDHRQITKGFSHFLQPQGKNSFFLYLFHGVLIEVMRLFIPEDTILIVAVLMGVSCVLIVWLMSYWLDKRKYYFII